MTRDPNLHADSPFPETLPPDLWSYQKLHEDSLANREEFWRTQAKRVRWITPFDKVVEEDLRAAKVAWFSGGKLNASVNALDVQIELGHGERTALRSLDLCGGETVLTYKALHVEVLKIAGAIKAAGLVAGERLALYLPDCAISIQFMLACARLGVIYVPIGHRLSAEQAVERIQNVGAKLVVVGGRGSEFIERAAGLAAGLKDVRLVSVAKETVPGIKPLADFLAQSVETEPYAAEAEHPLFIIYSNYFTGIPRGAVFATGGYLVQASASYQAIFGNAGERLLNSVGLKGAAGQCYGIWGPMLNGKEVVLLSEEEQINGERFKEIAERSGARAMFTTPRLLAAVQETLAASPLEDEKRFKVLASCLDVLSPRLARFAAEKLAVSADAVLNLWIQHENGASVIHSYASHALTRPGALGLVFPAIEARVLGEGNLVSKPNESGHLVFSTSWPAMARTIWGQPERYKELYFNRVPGCFYTNDGVRQDNDGFFWFMGRLDDVIKYHGQSLATSEVEAVLIAHPSVSDAAVVGADLDEGERLFAFVVPTSSGILVAKDELEKMKEELIEHIVRRIGKFAIPGRFLFASELPRTRTGKIVRRVLKRIAAGDLRSDEDLSHVNNPQAVTDLLRNLEK